MRNNIFNTMASIVFITILMTSCLYAHENDVVHPGLTNAASEVADISEISARCNFDINTDPQCSFIDEGSVKEDLGVYSFNSWDTERWGLDACWLNGLNWIHHSYNPITGGGWWDLGGIDTLNYALPRWNQSIYEYKYGNKDKGSFMLGWVAHLLEDMSSPAHVHGDIHTAGDDFEDYGANYFDRYDFSSMGLVPEIPTGNILLPSGVTVEGDSIKGMLHSLAKATYDFTSYQGHLQEIAGIQPDSELSRMFPTLHYVDGGILGDNYWEIDNIGQYKATGNDEWWVCEGDYTEYEDAGNVNHIEGKFYIENSAGDDGLLKPEVFEKPGAIISNPNNSLLDIYADNLYPKTVSCVAGMFAVFVDADIHIEQTEPTEVSGTISSDTTWTLGNSPYHIVGDITVASGATLTIEAGVIVKFLAARGIDGNYRLFVHGTLNLLGTSGNEVVFTSSRDDVYGGDSNGDGSTTSPNKSDWGYIQINNASSNIHHAIFRYGGYRRSYYNMLWINDCSPIISNCTFEYAYDKAIYYYAEQSYNSSPQIVNNTFRSNPYGLYFVGCNSLNSSPSISGNNLSGCSNIGIYVNNSNFTANISNNIVSNCPTAISTNADGLVSNNQITSASSYGIQITNASPTVSNNTIQSVGTNSVIYFNGTSTPLLSDNAITGTKEPSVAVSGTISSDTTWTLGNSPYHIVGDITVASGATLTIEAGVIVKFLAARGIDGNYRLFVHGTLNLLGTSGNEVVFTSSRDDVYGGDSNGDGSTTSPNKSDWGYIQINNASSNIHHAIFRYGGYRRSYYNMLWINDCSPIISNCTFEYAYDKAIYYYAEQSYNSSPQIVNNTFRSNPYGLYFSGGSASVVSPPKIEGNFICYNTTAGIYLHRTHGGTVLKYNIIRNNTYGIRCNSAYVIINENNIYDNSSWGVYNDTSSININAKRNWWGDVSGPIHASNPSGAGDKVSNYVDFISWQTESVSSGGTGVPLITSNPLTYGIMNYRYDYDNDNIAQAVGIRPLTWSVVYGPAGFQINSSTGLITWYPEEPGPFSVVLMAENAYGSDIQAFNVYVGLDDAGGPGDTQVTQVPQVVGFSLSSAQQTISASNLSVGTISYVYNNAIPTNCIIRQTPSANVVVNEDYPVNLLVSLGIAGNLNGDNEVNLTDFAILANDWIFEYDMADLIDLAGNWLNSGTVKLYEIIDGYPGITLSGQWQFGTPLGLGGVEYGYADPESGYTGENVYGVNIYGDYNTSAGGPYHLTAGPFDCSSYSDIELKFARWLNIDESLYAQAAIEVSNNGTDWHVVWQHNGDQPITDDRWRIVEYNISQFAANHSNVFIRWSYQINDWVYPYSGWNVDDIELLGTK
ncbi:MAG: right-handed parallel beta-helix repeat-containing protein [Phycisphaerae bacterium]|nr:right-handed parallel beta-helix repeat-containing protein [Phycisphaerae bacterium]